MSELTERLKIYAAMLEARANITDGVVSMTRAADAQFARDVVKLSEKIDYLLPERHP